MPPVEDDDDRFSDAVVDFEESQVSEESKVENESSERRARYPEIQYQEGLRRRLCRSLSSSTIDRISDDNSIDPTGEQAESDPFGGAVIAPDKGRYEFSTEHVEMDRDDDSFSIDSSIFHDPTTDSVSDWPEFIDKLVESELGLAKYEPSHSSGIISSILQGPSSDSVAERFELLAKSVENEMGLVKSESSTVQCASSHCMVGDGNERSTAASVNMDGDNDSFSVYSPVDMGGRSSSSLVFMVGLIMKAIGFQFKLTLGLFSLPVLFVYYTFAFITNPFQTLGQGRDYLVGNIVGTAGFAFSIFSHFASRFSKLTLRFGQGFLWSVYVYIILLGLLVSSFLMSGFWMQYMVEEPLRMKDALFFDYTKNSPVANFPVTYCPNAYEVAKSGHLRAIPRNQKFQVTVSLTLPESDYNRNLGVFQVRVDCLSAEGKVLATSRHPSMLPYRSRPIRLLQTSLKIAPLLIGYKSESQTLNLQIRDFIEGNVPTACLNVMIEPRAQYRDGAGLPELYDASLLLQSDLPFFKWILWQWRKTIFIWMSMTFFMTGLLLTFVFCTPMLLPRPRPNEESIDDNIWGAAVSMADGSIEGSC